MTRRAVVTGGAGFVGSWLCERLLGDGWSVTVVDNLLTSTGENLPSNDPRISIEELDVSNPFDVVGRVDTVFHLASPASPVHYGQFPLETLRAGSRGTEHAVQLAERKQARFLLASTSEVYGDPLVHPQTEAYWGNVNPTGQRSVYDEAKRFAEATVSAYCRAGRIDGVIARIFNTFGPRMTSHDGRVVPALIDEALANEPLTVAGDGRQTRTLCYVTDTVDALVRLAAASTAGPVNIGGEKEITIRELADVICTLAGSTSTIEYVPRPKDDPVVRCPDISLAREILGWRPRVSMTDGLIETIAARRAELGAQVQAMPGST